MNKLVNVPFDDLHVGMATQVRRLCVLDDLLAFTHATGALNPGAFAAPGGAPVRAPAAWINALVASVLERELPGPGTRHAAHSIDYLGEVSPGDDLVIRVEVTEKAEDLKATLKTRVETDDGRLVASGEAHVVAPATAVSGTFDEAPDLIVESHVHFNRLLADASASEPMPTAIVVPEEAKALGGALLAAEHGLITPILVGDPDRIRAAAAEIGADISAYPIEAAGSHGESAAKAVAMIHSGQAHALMKGHLHTDVLLSEVVKSGTGLRTGRRLSHVFLMDVPGRPNPIAVTDAAINIMPDLQTKADIAQNAIDLFRALGIDKPRVAVLAAVETINPKIPSTIDAASLSKMAERGQITGGIVDGPLAMDNAVDAGAARTKGIVSLVAGNADILLAPNLDAGNMIAKELIYVAHAEAAGLVIGAQCPVILTSRADSDKARLASCAVAALMVQNTRKPGADRR